MAPVAPGPSPTGRFGQRRCVPDLDGPAIAVGDDLPPIGTDSHAVELVAASVEQGEDLTVGRRIPELDRPVSPGGGEAAAVGAECHAVDRIGMPVETRELAAARRLQDVDHRAGRAGEPPLAGVERETIDSLEVAPQRGKLPPGRHIPDLYLRGMEPVGLLAGQGESMTISTEPQR